MPSNHKVYQKKTADKEKTALLKFFFCPLCAISLFISRLKSSFRTNDKVVLGTDALIFKAGVFQARPFFSFISLLRIEQPRGGTRAQQRGSRQGRGLAPYITALCFVLLLFLTGCQAIPQKKPLTDIEKKRLRQDILFDFFNAWRLKQDEQEFLNRERNPDGTENISNKKSGPGSSTRQGSISNQGAAVRLANQPRGKGEGKAGTCVEAEQGEATQEIEKTGAQIQKGQKGQVG
ncbi:hypothetical protein LCGC14_0840610 [marine sediment metagenome]|uniref:Uncharacterized protein n=1 Tax=marine sediment metagenome TaxID=412755 RepID=A0A0F9SKL8_9ZZZZ